MRLQNSARFPSVVGNSPTVTNPNAIISVPFKRHIGICLAHPLVEREKQAVRLSFAIAHAAENHLALSSWPESQSEVKFAGERQFFTDEVGLFTGEVNRLNAFCRGAA